jgi:hypothetical protein
MFSPPKRRLSSSLSDLKEIGCKSVWLAGLYFAASAHKDQWNNYWPSK